MKKQDYFTGDPLLNVRTLRWKKNTNCDFKIYIIISMS